MICCNRWHQFDSTAYVLAVTGFTLWVNIITKVTDIETTDNIVIGTALKKLGYIYKGAKVYEFEKHTLYQYERRN